MKKRGQITIFIIVGIVLVAIAILIFIFRREILPFIYDTESNPEDFLTSCMEKSLKETLFRLSMEGGGTGQYKTFQFEEDATSHNISYLCYNRNNYLPCINQQPMLLNYLKQEVKGEMNDEVKNCFDDYVSSLEGKGYDVKQLYNGFNVTLTSGQAIIGIRGEITFSKGNETSTNKDFNILMPTKFYDIAVVSQEIISQEARFCNFNDVGFMFSYPEFDIKKFRTSDLSIIYSVGHRDSKEKFRFAIRGCVIPPGVNQEVK